MSHHYPGVGATELISFLISDDQMKYSKDKYQKNNTLTTTFYFFSLAGFRTIIGIMEMTFQIFEDVIALNGSSLVRAVI